MNQGSIFKIWDNIYLQIYQCTNIGCSYICCEPEKNIGGIRQTILFSSLLVSFTSMTRHTYLNGFSSSKQLPYCFPHSTKIDYKIISPTVQGVSEFFLHSKFFTFCVIALVVLRSQNKIIYVSMVILSITYFLSSNGCRDII